MYKIIDGQGGGLMSGRYFASREAVRDQLASFHSADVANTDKMTLDDLLEIGVWELVEVDRLKEAAHLIAERLADNKSHPLADDGTRYSEEELILFSLEEAEENDGLEVSLR